MKPRAHSSRSGTPSSKDADGRERSAPHDVRCSQPATMNTAGMHQRGATKSTLGSSVAVIIIVIALLTAVPVGAQTPIPQLALWEANAQLRAARV